MKDKKEKTKPIETIETENINMIRQTSSYKNTKCEPDNNLFFEERSNPLSSKGN